MALAAIQGLNQKLEAELKQKNDQISALAAQLAAQSEQIKSLQIEFAQLREKPTALEARK